MEEEEQGEQQHAKDGERCSAPPDISVRYRAIRGIHRSLLLDPFFLPHNGACTLASPHARYEGLLFMVEMVCGDEGKPILRQSPGGLI